MVRFSINAAEAVAEPDHLHAVGADRGLADAADRRVQARAVAARGQDADRTSPWVSAL